MAVKKKANKTTEHHQYDFDDIINRGGKTTADEKPEKDGKEIRVTLRIPKKMITRIDKARKIRVGTVSRNQWIVEVLAKQIRKNYSDTKNV